MPLFLLRHKLGGIASSASFRGDATASNPESRDSGFSPDGLPRNDGIYDAVGLNLGDHALAVLDGAIIAPPQMRRGAAQRTPGLRQRHHLFRRRARRQAEPDLDRFLDREIAGG